MTRPTYREINLKVRQAVVAVTSGKIAVINPLSLACDALELDYNVKDLCDVLLSVLKQISPANYVGGYPPLQSYEDEIFQSDLYAFKLDCHDFGCNIYLKFALKEDVLWLVSFHRDRPQNR